LIGAPPRVARQAKGPALLGFSWLRPLTVEADTDTRECHSDIRPQFREISLLKKMAKVSSVKRKWAFAMILPSFLVFEEREKE